MEAKSISDTLLVLRSMKANPKTLIFPHIIPVQIITHHNPEQVMQCVLVQRIIIIIGFLIKRWSNGPLNPIKKDLTGKIIIITGSSDGIGLEAAKDLLRSNAKVILDCRNKNKTEGIINTLPENLRKNAIFEQLDLSSFKVSKILSKK